MITKDIECSLRRNLNYSWWEMKRIYLFPKVIYAKMNTTDSAGIRTRHSDFMFWAANIRLTYHRILFSHTIKIANILKTQYLTSAIFELQRFHLYVKNICTEMISTHFVANVLKFKNLTSIVPRYFIPKFIHIKKRVYLSLAF